MILWRCVAVTQKEITGVGRMIAGVVSLIGRTWSSTLPVAMSHPAAGTEHVCWGVTCTALHEQAPHLPQAERERSPHDQGQGGLQGHEPRGTDRNALSCLICMSCAPSPWQQSAGHWLAAWQVPQDKENEPWWVLLLFGRSPANKCKADSRTQQPDCRSHRALPARPSETHTQECQNEVNACRHIWSERPISSYTWSPWRQRSGLSDVHFLCSFLSFKEFTVNTVNPPTIRCRSKDFSDGPIQERILRTTQTYPVLWIERHVCSG